MKDKRLVRDGLLGAGVLLAAGILYLLLHQSTGVGAWAVIEQDGIEIARMPLNQKGSYLVQSKAGHNLVCTAEGGVWIEEADCPDQYCVRQGAISTADGRIVCLPHRLVVRVEGAASAAGGMVR